MALLRLKEVRVRVQNLPLEEVEQMFNHGMDGRRWRGCRYKFSKANAVLCLMTRS